MEHNEILHLLLQDFICKKHYVNAENYTWLNGATWAYTKHTPLLKRLPSTPGCLGCEEPHPPTTGATTFPQFQKTCRPLLPKSSQAATLPKPTFRSKYQVVFLYLPTLNRLIDVKLCYHFCQAPILFWVPILFISSKVLSVVPITPFSQFASCGLHYTILHSTVISQECMLCDSRTDCNFKLLLLILYSHHSPLLPFSSANASFLVY